jgi:hypothetical protein
VANNNATTLPRVVANRSKPVVAKPIATTRTGENATTRGSIATWRIEINRRKLANGGYSHHWNYRFTIDGQRRAVYGGNLEKLIALNPARWNVYMSNSMTGKRVRQNGKKETR